MVAMVSIIQPLTTPLLKRPIPKNLISPPAAHIERRPLRSVIASPPKNLRRKPISPLIRFSPKKRRISSVIARPPTDDEIAEAISHSGRGSWSRSTKKRVRTRPANTRPNGQDEG
jgi:hypothetical protein